MFGLALDCDLENVTETEELFVLLDRDFPNLRIGKYTDTGSFIHLDIGWVISPRASEDWLMGARWYK
jgi:hypothetical protein